MKNTSFITDYEVTKDSDFLDVQNSLTPVLKKKIIKYHQMALKGKESDIPKLLAAIDQYPDNPQLKNYLSVLYSNIGNVQKTHETNRWINAEHPDYLFGKLNLAFECLEKEEYHKVPEILGEAMEIKSLYPKRDKFHLNEVTSFFRCSILYFVGLGDID